MFRNYIKIAWRNLIKSKVYSGINIMGLAIGLTAGFLILLYVNFELSYDKFHAKGDRIYRVVSDLKTPDGVMKTDVPSCAVSPHLQEEFPEVISAVRLMYLNLAVRKDDIKFIENDAAAADEAFFEMFDFTLLQGDKKDVLRKPFSVVLTKTTAKKYFGDQQAIGQTLKIKDEDINDLSFTVTGIMDDIPENSQIKANMVISMTTYSQSILPTIDDAWGTYDPYTYILLHPNTNPNALEEKFPEFLERNTGEMMKRDQLYVSLYLEPFQEVYLHSARSMGDADGDINSVYVFSVVAIFILLIACINFINLTTARSVERAKEVGVRKVIGAEKPQLAIQFVGESIIICLIAFMITIMLTALILPTFNTLAGKVISQGIFSNPIHIFYLFLITITIGVLAGIYPAFVISSFKPVHVLKGSFSTGTKGIILRKVLVITQFTISIALILGTIIIYTQMDFMRSQELGFDKEHTIVLNTRVSPSQKELKDKLNDLPNVLSTSLASSVPGTNNAIAYSTLENSNNEDQAVSISAYFVDYDFISQFGLKILAGRGFSRTFATDSTQAMIVNEKATQLLGFTSPEKAIGAHFSQWGKEGKIIGVLQDFHFKTLEENIVPLTMTMKRDQMDLIAVKVKGQNIKETLASVQELWETVVPNEAFDFYFLDESFDKQYRTQERFGSLFFNFAILAILISCLGLFGLAAYSILQRRREIGVRKVLGASVGEVVKLLSKDFLKLVIVAFAIASPIAWFLMDYWLAEFAYRISVQWWMFVLAGSCAFIIALLTISFHAIKASLTNPIISLRTE
ncbi:ABC transporter permease [Aquimarina algicola]|uniref:FtsX-like permease family protein n=1 Tax=Aquimarina algicola TaxID=2589995 RepID=A0A504JK59_9FLAO|nr:ABC transporter permease [Aquimarina algicola]TPN88013.1 FtsX-like permease family protein [Aquimarina algicola]